MPDPVSRERWKALEPILDAALDRDPSERAAFLDEACRGDAAMRVEVERLLAACERSEALLTTPAAAVFAPLLSEPIGPLPELLGARYRIVRELGRGGMATVYLADDPKHRRQVAVKVLHDELARRVGRERFLREIGIAARLSHPHILAVHDSGDASTHSDGREGPSFLFYVSPFVAGESLRERLQRDGRLPVPEAVRFAREVAEALEYAHREGVIHRDIKPANILLLEGHAVVADFGIARAISGAADEVTLGDAPLVLGTPAYMSPEQAAGSRALDGRTDVYSLGCVLYEMLTGERPGGTSRLAEVASPDLSVIVQRAMAPAAEDRFASAGELVRALSALSSGASSSGRRRWRSAAALFTLVLSVALAWSFWPADPAPEGSIVVLPFANMTPYAGNEYVSDGLTEEIITRLAAVPDLKVISRTSAMHYKGTKAPLRQIANDLKVAHVLEGSVRQNEDQMRITVQLIDAGTDAHLWAETYDFPPRDLFTVQERIAREILRALQLEPGAHGNRTLARRATGDTVAYEFYRRGRYFWAKRTREGHERAIAYYNQAIARDSSYAEPYAGLADAYLTQYQNDLSVEREAEVYARMKWAAERALALDDQSADAHASFAASLLWQRNWPGAEREFRRALELNPGNASARSWYALLMISMGRLEEARRESQRALELDPFSIITSMVVAQACYVARDYDCTIEEQRKTLELSDSWVPAYMGRGMAYSMAGKHDAAIRDLTKAVELAPRFAGSISDFAYVLARAGRETEARDALRRAKLNPVPAAFRIGRVHAALGEADSAFAWLDRSRWQWAHIAVLSDPALDPVRADARFAQLTLRVEREMGVK